MLKSDRQTDLLATLDLGTITGPRLDSEVFDKEAERGIHSPAYDTVPAARIWHDGPYLKILPVNGPSNACYASATYEGQTYCVPLEAAHTSMLMDIAVILRNLNITPTDLNAPVSVRIAE